MFAGVCRTKYRAGTAAGTVIVTKNRETFGHLGRSAAGVSSDYDLVDRIAGEPEKIEKTSMIPARG